MLGLGLGLRLRLGLGLRFKVRVRSKVYGLWYIFVHLSFWVRAESDHSDHSEQNLSGTQPKVGQICSEYPPYSKDLLRSVTSCERPPREFMGAIRDKFYS